MGVLFVAAASAIFIAVSSAGIIGTTSEQHNNNSSPYYFSNGVVGFCWGIVVVEQNGNVRSLSQKMFQGLMSCVFQDLN